MVEVVRRLYLGARMGGTKSVSLQHWLLWFGEASDKIKHIVEEFAEWLIDKRPPWSAYCMLM